MGNYGPNDNYGSSKYSGPFDDFGAGANAGYRVTTDSEDIDEWSRNQRFNQSTDLHRILHSAYTFVRGAETTKAIAGLTLDHLLSDHIKALKTKEKRVMSDATGSGIDSRKSRWDQLDELEKQFKAVVEAIREAGDDKIKLRALGVYEVDQRVNTGNQL